MKILKRIICYYKNHKWSKWQAVNYRVEGSLYPIVGYKERACLRCLKIEKTRLNVITGGNDDE